MSAVTILTTMDVMQNASFHFFLNFNLHYSVLRRICHATGLTNAPSQHI